jgi:uncharacterized protein YjbI with pentapeptide repeats
MSPIYISNKEFDSCNCKEKPLAGGNMNSVPSVSCDFSESDFSGFIFSDCSFIQCNISLVKTRMTSFQDTVFKNCKMLGLHFEDCNEFSLSFQFDGCILDHSSFYKTSIRNTLFRNTRLQDVDFTECDLSGSKFEECNLLNSMFDHTNLEKADLRTAHHFSINPEINKVKKARFSLAGLPGLLNNYDLIID